MPFSCPYCNHSIHVKSAKPGKYKPKCPGCQRVFHLTVPADPKAQPVAQAVEPEAVPAPRAPSVDLNKTGEFTEAPAGPKSPPGPPTSPSEPSSDVRPSSPAAASETTGVFDQTSEQGQGLDDSTAIAPPSTRVGNASDESGNFDVNMSSRITADGPDTQAEVPDSLVGYHLIKELGRGGMGAVYLAQQVSLNRPVALKVMNPAWGNDPGFVARFTREAYAAAQLTHHNIVQIYDFGTDKKFHYFSMEFVDGKSLGDIIKKEGKIDVEEAVIYTLQSARGLKFAHDRGMIHRDIKPDNLMLNNQCVVKVADLGLVKTPDAREEQLTADHKALPNAGGAASATLSAPPANVTRVGVAMGTPAYMSPEQARDAATVDPRADIYSLGCTLYALVTGKPPFTGKTVMEIFSQHATAPIKIPEIVLKRMPRELQAILQKMVAKKPEDRFADMGEVVKTLEDWLGEKSGGKSPSLDEAQVSKLEECVKRFNDVKLAKLSTLLKLVIVGGCGVLALLFLIAGLWQWSFGMLFLAAETGLAYFAVSGFFNPGPVDTRVRALALGSIWKLILYAVVGVPLFLAILWVVGLLWVWLAVTVVAVVLACGLHFGLDRLVDSQRAGPLDDAEALFKQLRLRGMDEESLRNFLCKYSGAQWEEFYEALFGFEEKMKARDWWVRGQKGQARKKHAAWREPLVNWLDDRLKIRQEEREKTKLRKLEEQRLKAEGMSPADARLRAEQAADVMVSCAAEMRAEAKAGAFGDGNKPRSNALRMLRDIEKNPDPAPRTVSPTRLLRKCFEFFLGATIRFVVGALLVAGSLLWMHQNGLIDAAKNIHGVGQALRVLRAPDSHPVELAVAPSMVTHLFAGYAPAVAGLLLMLTALMSSYRGVLLTLVAAMVTFLGPRLGVPDIGPLTAAQLCMAIGGVLGLLGLVLGQRYRSR